MVDILEQNALERFLDDVRDSILKEGPAKGYSGATYDLFGPGHSMGEIYCKMKRWQKRGDPDDLVKIAGHAFVLFWNSIKGRDYAGRLIYESDEPQVHSGPDGQDTESNTGYSDYEGVTLAPI